MATLNLKLNASDPANILGLCSTLHDSSGAQIQIKINTYLQEQTGAALVFLVPLHISNEEVVIQVIGNKLLDREMRFPMTSNGLDLAIHQRSSILTQASKLEDDLREVIHLMVDPMPETFLTVPVPHPQQDKIVLLACIMKYQDCENAKLLCTQLVLECFRFCLGTVLNTLAYEEELRLKRQCQSLLSVAKNLFSHLGNMSDLLREIMTEARNLTNAERCSLFLLDTDHNELVAKVFDGELFNKDIKEVRISKTQGIAGQVVTTGEVLNIRNAYHHPLFFRGIDEATGFKTRNILCFPIRKDNGIIGVAQLCNKRNALYFDVFDEEVAMAFSIYCGISIMHSMVYKKIQDSQARNKLSNELMMYHMKVSDEDLQKVLNYECELNKHDITEFSFRPRSVSTAESMCYSLRMFEDIGFIKTFHINRETLTRFLLFVNKGYRDTPYHNWFHAFSVLHFSYALIKNLKLVERGFITTLEALAFMVSCVCHDLDHRGTTNSFQMQSGTVLASLYSSEGSVMERHHLSQALCILNTEGCHILEHLSQEEYTKCLDLIRDLILATDLAHHFRIFKEQQKIFKMGFNTSNDKHRELLLCLLMTCSDLSDQTKDWKVSKQIAELVYDEFFKQGDLEKAMGNSPLEMMDRERAKIPELQIQFLNDIVIPVFETLATLFPESESLVEASKTNLKCWSRASTIFATRWPKGHTSMEILTDPEFEKQVLSKVD